jgi:hypothetical protein
VLGDLGAGEALDEPHDERLAIRVGQVADRLQRGGGLDARRRPNGEIDSQVAGAIARKRCGDIRRPAVARCVGIACHTRDGQESLLATIYDDE